MTGSQSAGARVPAPLLVLGGIVSVQFGGALAATLIPHVGVGGSVLMRLGFATVILLMLVRPHVRGHGAAAWRTVIGFGVALGLMNWSFYGALSRLHIGVAVTVEFIGPLVLAAALSRRLLDGVAVLAAAFGVVLISRMTEVPLGSLDWLGLGLALTAGACWAAYVVLSGRTGARFDGLDGLAIAMCVATAVVVPVGAFTVRGWSAPDLARGLGIAVLSSVLPYSLELMALRRLSARVFGVLLSLEPAVAALAGFVVLRQHLGLRQLSGIALVVGASTLVLGSGDGATTPPQAVAETGA